MGFLQDIRFGLRMIARNPGFAAVAIITIALGIGVNSTVFTLTNAVLLKGLPFANPEEILYVTSTNDSRGQSRLSMSYPDYRDISEQAGSFSGLAAFTGTSLDVSDEAGAPERVAGARVAANLFTLLGQNPLKGHGFNPDDDAASAAPVALIGYGLWQNRYGGRDDILGKTIKANQKFYTVVGIMPQGMNFPNNEDMWIPLVPGTADEKRDSRSYSVVGRLRHGVTPQAAETEVRGVAQRLAQAYPETNKEIDARVQTASQFYNGDQIRTIFLTMQGAVAFVLLIACANVANLMLARAIRRTRETSIRTALGANRWRVIRQLLVESILISFMGGAIGLGLAAAGIRMFDRAVAGSGKPYWINFTMDYRVALFFVAVCVASGILFGLAPALQISRANINEQLRDGGRGSSGGRQSRRLTGALLIGEIGLTLVLLVGAGLMVRSFVNSQFFDLGVETDNLLVARLTARAAKYPDPASLVSFQDRLLARLSEVPGIEGLAITSNPPSNGAQGRRLKLEDRDLADASGQFPNVDMVTVSAGYFGATGIPLRRGREFAGSDGSPGGEAAVVNEAFAAKYWPGSDAVGRRIRLVSAEDSPWITVVGVSANVVQGNGGSQQSQDIYSPTVYVPFRQAPINGMAILARSHQVKDRLTADLRTAVQDLDPEMPLYSIATMDEIIAQRSWPFRVFGSLFAMFALIALLMSSIGIYAVTAYGMHQRTQEIGVRMALGANARQVMWLVLRQGLIRIGIGLAIGLAGAFALSRVMQAILFRVTASDPATFIGVSALLTAVTLAACFLPARRAMRLNPVAALRED